MHFKSLKECLLSNPNSTNSNRSCCLSTEYVYVGVPTGQHSWEVSLM